VTFTEPRTNLLRRLEPQVPHARADIDSGTGYEALLGLIMFAGHEPPGEYNVGEEWFSTVRAAASPELISAVEQLCGGVPTVFGHLLGLVRGAEAPRDLDALIRLVHDLPPERLRLELLGSSSTTVRRGIPRPVLEGAAEGDPAAVATLLDAAHGDLTWIRSLHAVLDLTPQQTSDLTVQVLSRWGEEVFAAQEADLAGRLSAQQHRWRAQAAHLGWREFVEDATGGIVLEDDLPAERVLIVPTVLGAPWVYSTHVLDTKIFCCPVREVNLLTRADVVRLLRALGDETRLAILHHLAVGGPATLAALTARLGISKSAVHKHLVLLRSAELVRLSLGQHRRYVLRTLPDLDALVTGAIERGT
jgi:DNA-binding transcriptional ArsR family regulator